MSAAEWVFLCGASVSRALHFLVGASGFLGFFKLALWLIVRLWCRSSSDAAAGEFSVCFRGSSPVRKFLSLIRCLGLGRASWGAYACCARSKVSRYTMLTSPVSQDRRRLPSSTGWGHLFGSPFIGQAFEGNSRVVTCFSCCPDPGFPSAVIGPVASVFPEFCRNGIFDPIIAPRFLIGGGASNGLFSECVAGDESFFEGCLLSSVSRSCLDVFWRF